MFAPAPFPQGNDFSVPAKPRPFARLRESFATGKTPAGNVTPPAPVFATPAPEPKPPAEPDLPPIQSELVDKVFSKLPTPPVVQPKVEKPSTPPVEEKLPPVASPPAESTDQFSSDFLQKILEEENPPDITSFAAAVPTAVNQAHADALNTQAVQAGTACAGKTKEVLPPAPPAPPTEHILPTESAPNIQFVENEPTLNMSPEVESFLEKVEDHHAQLPQEIVIAEQPGVQPIIQPIPQPVIILPITPQNEKIGAKKSPFTSIRWLVEWSRKVMKMFAGRVVYRTAE